MPVEEWERSQQLPVSLQSNALTPCIERGILFYYRVTGRRYVEEVVRLRVIFPPNGIAALAHLMEREWHPQQKQRHRVRCISDDDDDEDDVATVVGWVGGSDEDYDRGLVHEVDISYYDVTTWGNGTGYVHCRLCVRDEMGGF